MKPVIEIRDIAKRYRLGESKRFYGSFREVLLQGLRKPWNALRGASPQAKASAEPDSFWAVKGINLDVHKGETIGIIGANGAGKSTLLKILSRITEPTQGQAIIRGRLASLLEVGTGFHPELTGRENIYLNGAILGMTKVEIDSKFDEIVEFSEIAKFLDTPVKRYSSGMYVRLAFSIAAHLDPDILVVDEVLAVGDVAFQKKCMGKMGDARDQARTVVFVSHNIAAVESLCTRAVVLRDGQIVFDGAPKDAIDIYLRHEPLRAIHHARTSSISPARPAARRDAYPNSPGSSSTPTTTGPCCAGAVPIGAPFKAVVHFKLDRRCHNFHASIAFDTVFGQRVCTAHSAYEPNRPGDSRSGEQVFIGEIPSLPLVPGEYKIGVGLDIGDLEVDWINDAARLTVTRADYYGTGIVPVRGAFLLENRWTLLPEDRDERTAAAARQFSAAGRGIAPERTGTSMVADAS